MKYIIKELIIGEDEEMGIQAVSLVDEPAILENFVYFNDEVKLGRLSDKEIKLRDESEDSQNNTLKLVTKGLPISRGEQINTKRTLSSEKSIASLAIF